MSVEPNIFYRTIKQSSDIIEGLRTGRYKIYGGVIRIAKGNDKAGTIVAHLIFPTNAEQAMKSIESMNDLLSSQIGSIQNSMESLQGTIGTLKMLQQANLALSGLNLAVSMAGFVIVCRKLNNIDARLQSQSKILDSLLLLAQESRQRQWMLDHANFIALVNTARHFAEMGDVSELKSLVFDANKQYEFTRLLLLDAVKKSNDVRFFKLLPELEVLQERFMYLGLFRSFIQQKVATPKHSAESLEILQGHWLEISKTLVDTLGESTETLYRLSQTDGCKVLDFLNVRKERAEALEYQSELLRLAETNPEVISLLTEDSNEILFIAA